MTKKYKDAAQIVDLMKASGLPTMDQVLTYDNFTATMEKARWMKEYVEAVRTEKTGREIHHSRFFLKMDSGHKIRLKVLAKEMVQAVEVLDALQELAFDLWTSNDPARPWIKEFQASGASAASPAELPSSAAIDERDASAMDALKNSKYLMPQSTVFVAAEETEEDDLIEMKLRAQKREHLRKYRFLMESREEYLDRILSQVAERGDLDPELVRGVNIKIDVHLQYIRRILLHDPILSQKAYGKVSLRDLLIDPDFSIEDFNRLEVGMSKRIAIGLLWWKDATIEAIAMSPRAGKSDMAADVGAVDGRFPMIGGWVFCRRHTRTMTNEAWWYLLDVLKPPANVENRFMRLCNNYNDLHAFLSFGALGMFPPPSFSQKTPAIREHLSLCGVIIGDMVLSIIKVPSGPIPTFSPATRRGYVRWVEIERRAYIFGALRNDHDAFAEAFLSELRARPEKFVVVTRSETDPGQKTDMFGGHPGEPFTQYRVRTFEAPPASPQNQPEGSGKWEVVRSLVDVFYGKGDKRTVDGFDGHPIAMIKGYLTELESPQPAGRQWLFHFKRFPVKYFVILATTPNINGHELAMDVSWAALRAYGLAEGERTSSKYTRAADALVRKRAAELFSWMPANFGNGNSECGFPECKERTGEWILDALESMNF